MEKKTPDYNDPKILQNYALWYYTRYYPSFGKLREKLGSKSGNQKIIDSIIMEMRSIFNEENLLESLVQNLAGKGKSRRSIMHKLIQKRFAADDIEKALHHSGSGMMGDRYLLQKITSSLKTRSIQKTRYNLISSGYDKDIIDRIIVENHLKDDLLLIQSLIADMRSAGLDQEKIIGKMISRGFVYKDIKEMMG